LILEDVFHDIYSRSNLFFKKENDTNQVRSEFDLKISTNQFCKIDNISQTVYHNEMKFYKKILDISNYILIIFQIKWSSRTYYFQGSKLLDKSYQICQTRSLCIVYDISGDTYI
jgi:hypothetical protein